MAKEIYTGSPFKHILQEKNREGRKKKEQQTNDLRNLVINRLSNIKKQSQYNDTINEIRSLIEKIGKY